MFIFIVVVGVVVDFVESQVSNAISNNITQSTTNAQIIDVSGDELYQDYKDNEIAANQKYKNKLLRITAVIASIEADFLDKPFLTLQTHEEYAFNPPQAHLADKEIDKAAKLKKGQMVTLICKGDGEMIGAPMLAHCVIQ